MTNGKSTPAPAPRPLKERVLDAIPGYRQAEHRAAVFAQQVTPEWVSPEKDLISMYRQEIERAVLAGEDLKGLRYQYAQQRSDQVYRDEFNRLVFQMAEDAKQEQEYLREHARSGVALEILAEELDSLFADIVTHREIIAAHPVSAEQALFTDDGAARWKLVTDLIERYTEIRREHLAAVLAQNSQMKGQAGVFYVVAQTPHFLNVEPFWIVGRKKSTPPNEARREVISAWYGLGRAEASIPEKWLGPFAATRGNPNFDVRQFFSSVAARAVPEDAVRRELFPVGQTNAEWLLTLADAGPWLPDADTILEAERLAREMLRPSSNAVFFDRAQKLEAIGVATGVAFPDSMLSPSNRGHGVHVTATAGGVL